MDATAFLSLWHTDRAAARRQSLALGARLISLTVAVSAQFAAHDPRGCYSYWVRAIRCPDLPGELRSAGWRWTADGDLASERLRVVVRRDGDVAIAAAQAITEALRTMPVQQQASHAQPRQERKFEAPQSTAQMRMEL